MVNTGIICKPMQFFKQNVPKRDSAKDWKKTLLSSSWAIAVGGNLYTDTAQVGWGFLS